ncbi:hypothetical protein GCM10007108_16960 [Thermogymnomonas acidicola]|uniref:PRC-barrel domain-containing protein n=1 Tax=Thermogymnomonas acidicola TaxID=399579 RepID=A0AA37BSM0_9ARCH|nr:PRC-barrel domain-containing protein [Thermogymnomonas acidicola]GGM79333.1 hypothetical protein GCM10007108_16960 [Thermogymnomonas acidicola]
MLSHVTDLIGMTVYTDKGIVVGNVDDLIVDIDGLRIYGLYISRTNSKLVEDGVAVSVPYGWIKAVGDVILLRRFPQYVRKPKD